MEKVAPGQHPRVVDGASLHTTSVVAVQAVFTPPGHVEAAVHAAQGAFPEAEKVVPAAHATWHTVSVVLVQAVLTPAVHVASAAQVLHPGAFPEAEKVELATHGTYVERRRKGVDIDECSWWVFV